MKPTRKIDSVIAVANRPIERTTIPPDAYHFWATVPRPSPVCGSKSASEPTMSACAATTAMIHNAVAATGRARYCAAFFPALTTRPASFGPARLIHDAVATIGRARYFAASFPTSINPVKHCAFRPRSGSHLPLQKDHRGTSKEDLQESLSSFDESDKATHDSRFVRCVKQRSTVPEGRQNCVHSGCGSVVTRGRGRRGDRGAGLRRQALASRLADRAE